MNIPKLIGTSLGLGYMPIAPGTFGALGGLFVTYLLSLNFTAPFYLNVFHFLLIIITYTAGVYSCISLNNEWGHDPSKIVIDETMGFWVSIIFLPLNIYSMIGAFILFRFFDILKPLGIKSIDKLTTNHSVMLDDLLAGIYANCVLHLFLYLYPKN